MRYCASSRKVAGSNSDELITFFSIYYSSSRTMALGSTQPLTEMSTRNLLGGSKGRPARKANLTAIYEPIVLENVGASTLTDCLENVSALISHNPVGLNGRLQE
jgi:hypothetical protein